MRLLRDQPFGGKLHVMICIRDIVLSSVLRSEHADRYRDSPHIRMLSWDEESLRFFLQAKLERLPERYLMRATDNVKSVASWLGIETIENNQRGENLVERIDDYILRHIRPLPRDLVSLGNKLCRAVGMAKARGAAELAPALIKDIVGEAAKQFGDLQLTICANQMSADMLYPQVVRKSSVSATAYAPAINQQLKRFLHLHVGCDRFDNARCLEIADLASSEFSSQTDVLSVLWQHGLIGYCEGELYSRDITFYRLNDSAEDLVLPLDRDFYALHSCLIESAAIAPIGPPVFPFRRRPPFAARSEEPIA
jgi:hypothetical protein